MQTKQVIIATGAIVVGVMLGSVVRPAQAAFFDRDKLAHALAARFALDERAVSDFLAEFQYHPVVSPTPVPTPAPIVVSGVTYKYDQYTDVYYAADKVVGVQHRNHLKFIGEQLQKEVARGAMTQVTSRKILDKLAELMNKAPSTEKFLSMNFVAQQVEINKFKQEMDAWMKAQGMTLAQLRAITGKGNKFLMGIYY